jgi:4-alpha-glucanotransferase
MKILSFAFNGDKGNLYLPETLPENSVCYTGTHDNDTLRGLIESLNDWDKNNLVIGVGESLAKLGLSGDTSTVEGLIEAIIELGFASKANTFILPMQDVLGLGGDYRINTPGLVLDVNWAVRFEDKDFSRAVSDKLKALTKKYDR